MFFTSARGQDALLGLPLFLWAQGMGLRMALSINIKLYILKLISIFFKYKLYNYDMHHRSDLLSIHNLVISFIIASPFKSHVRIVHILWLLGVGA